VKPEIIFSFRVRYRVKEVMQKIDPSDRTTPNCQEPSEIVFSNASLDSFLKQKLEKVKFSFDQKSPEKKFIALGVVNAEQSFIRLTAVSIPETETMYSLTLSVILDGGKSELSLDDLNIKLKLVSDDSLHKARRRETLTGKFYEVLKYKEVYSFTVGQYNPMEHSGTALNLAEISLPHSMARNNGKVPLEPPPEQNGVATETSPKPTLNGKPVGNAGVPVKVVTPG